MRLTRAGGEREGDVTPGVEKRRRRWQMEDDAAHGADDMEGRIGKDAAKRATVEIGSGWGGDRVEGAQGRHYCY